MADRLSTGISILDRQLEGGVPAGSILLLNASPASQSELFLHELTATRETLYLTTVRSEQAVKNSLERSPARAGTPTIRGVDADAPLDRANELIRALPEGANLIIDVLDQLEGADEGRYRKFLNAMETHITNTGGLAVLHGLDGRTVPSNRDLTEHMADVVFDLETGIEGTEIVNRLAVPKFRGGRALDETIKLQLRDSVTVDTSRDIA